MSKSMQLKARIKNLSLKHHISAQAVLQNFMLERLLERISLSTHKDRFILKGGMLIASLIGIENRTTMDMDATLTEYPLSEETLHLALSDICNIQLSDDTTFILNSIEPIRDDNEYGGFRVAILGKYELMKISLKLDITAGDVITPSAVQYAFHSGFEEKTISVWAYNIETILAEKVETILRRGVLNTRLRDFYDVYILTKKKKINKKLFISALNGTSQQRDSLDTVQDNENILAIINTNNTLIQRWKLYSAENYYARDIAFGEIIDTLTNLLK